MQVFKLYLKLLRANLRMFFMYLGIFSGLLFGIIIPNQTKDAKASYIETKCSFAVLDEDQSEISRAVIGYLTQRHNYKEIKAFEKEKIQDELFFRNIDAAVHLKSGFEEAVIKGTADAYAEIYVIPNTSTASLFEQEYNGYMSKLSSYLVGGFDRTEAIEKVNEVCRKEVAVSFMEGKAVSLHSSSYYFYLYLSWVFLAVCIQAVAPVLCIMDRKEVKNRVYVSSYRFSSYNLEILLATMVTGILYCVVFWILDAIVLSDNLLSLRGLLSMLNMLCFMVVAMGFTLLASKLTSSGPVLSAISNIVSLGMAFTCGVFVPLEFLGDGVIRIAHFLPAYWYGQAIDQIISSSSLDFGKIFSYMGIELLFGGAIIAVAFLIAKKKAI